MRAARFYGYKDIRIEEVPVPTPGPGQVRISVEWAGICGTDRHEYVGPNFIPTLRPHRLTGRVAPLIMGHEFTGYISQLGEGVEGWQIGDRVTANGTLSCGACEACRSGRFNVCSKLGFLGVSTDGAFAEEVVVSAARLFRIPEGLSMRTAVLAEPLACGLHATRLLGDIASRDVVILGPGIIGLSAFFAARQAGAGRILVSGIGDWRKDLIEQNGGTYVHAFRGALNRVVSEWSGGRLADVIYECIGSESTLDQAIRSCKPGGRIMVMGVFGQRPTVDINTLQEAERSLLTSQAHVDEIGEALKLLMDGAIPGEALITREVTLDTLVRDGFEDLIAHGPEHIKVLIRIRG